MANVNRNHRITCQAYGKPLELDQWQKSKLLEIVGFDDELFDPDLFFQDVLNSCQNYLARNHLSRATTDRKNVRHWLEQLIILLDDFLRIFATFATPNIINNHRRQRAKELELDKITLKELINRNRSDKLPINTKPINHAFFQSQFRNIFPNYDLHSVDRSNESSIAHTPYCELACDKIIEDLLLQDEKTIMAGFIDISYADLLDQVETKNLLEDDNSAKRTIFKLIENHMQCVQKVQYHDLYELLRQMRVSIETMLYYIPEGRIGDLALDDLIRKLSSTFNRCLSEEERTHTKQGTARTKGYTSKRNKEFILYVTDLIINFQKENGVTPSNEMLALKNSFFSVKRGQKTDTRYAQNYRLNKASKSTRKHQLDPDSDDWSFKKLMKRKRVRKLKFTDNR